MPLSPLPAATVRSAVTYLTDQERTLLLRMAMRRSYRRGEVILQQGVRLHGLYIIHRGKVRVEVEGEGSTVLTQLGPGQLFGEMAFLMNSPASASIVADEEVEVDSIRRDDVYALLNARA